MINSDLPKIDRSNIARNFSKTRGDEIDIGWYEGVLCDGRPYRLEMWCIDQVSNVTLFFSTKGMENAVKLDFIEILSQNELLRFKHGTEYLAAKKFIDPVGNEFWSVNIVIGDNEDLFVTISPPIKKYQ